MIKKILFAVILFFLVINSAECKTTITQTENNYFYPVADRYVYEKNNTISVNDMELRVGNQNTIDFGDIKSVLKFDISAIPENAIISEASLYVYSFDTKPSWDIRSIQAYAAPENWSELSIDWTLLNDVNAQIHESSFIAGIPGSSPDSYSWDITNMVQSWANGEKNFGIVLQYDAENFNDYIIIHSGNNLLFRPYLNISYTRTEPPLPEHSLPIETVKGMNALTVNEPTVVERLVKTEKAEKPSSPASLHHVDPTPLVNPIILNDTLSNPVQTPPQTILPEITRHPQSQLKNPGTPVNFLVTASGTPPLLFQWQKDSVDIEGETSKSLTIESISVDTEGIYTCSISNNAGSVLSNGAELYLNDAAEIIEQPVSQSIAHGKPVTFSLAAAGSGSLSYQWKKNHIIIHGATTDSYTIASVQKEDEGVYICEVSNDFSNDISNDALLVVITRPQITQQPLSQVKPPGTPVTFAIKASPPPLSYQWLKDGVAIDGETSESYTIDSVSKEDEGIFTCNVSNNAGNVLSNGAELNVNKAAEIIEQPVSKSIVHGKPVTFSLAGAGTGPLSYQWKKNHITIHGATTNRYTIASVQKEDEGVYTCEVRNNFSNNISNDAILVVITPPQITKQPLSQIKNPGMPVTFSVTASGKPRVSFQWLKDDVTIEGEIFENYTIDSVSEKDEGTFICNVSNDAGKLTSSPAILSINNPLKISHHPLSQVINPQASISFSVKASGTQPLSYQWVKDGSVIQNANSDTYTIDSVSKNDEGAFTCKVTNDAGSLTSNQAVLTVNDSVIITKQPLSFSKISGESVSFSVEAAGTKPLSFQWEKNDLDILGATTNSYTITSVQDDDGGVYKCKVSNDFSNIISDGADLILKNPAQITRHPQSQIKNPGTPVTFSVTATGTPPLLFQWQKDNVDIDGATSKDFSIGSISGNNEGVFTCTVTNDAGSLTSNQAVLTVNDSVKIIEQPLSFSKSSGESVTFSVEAAGTEPLSFQWKKNGLDIVGATSKSYTITSVQNADGGAYKCRVNNDFSHIISNRADLILKNSAQINKHPQSRSKNPGTNVTFSVTATGTPPLLFQWQKDDVDIQGATSEDFTINSISENDEGLYACTVSNDAGSVRSDDAELFVNDPVKIIKQPLSQSNNLGEPVTFTITAAGSTPLSFQWEKDHINIPGATAQIYTIASVQNKDGGAYKCKVSNGFSDIVSDNALLSLKIPPRIKRHPQSQRKNPGASVNFLVTASGTPLLLFQWQKDGVDINGKTSKSFTIHSIAENDEGFYSCKIKNDAGSVRSDDAELLVNDPAQIKIHPQSQAKKIGEPVIFSVTPAGAAPWTFQWEKDHIVIPGATSRTYTIDSFQKNDEGIYTCEVSNAFSNSVSNNAHLTLKIPLQVNQHPHSQLVNPETAVTFSVTASGTPPLKFQWQKDSVDIGGATTKDFTIDSITKNDEGFYSCKVSNDSGIIISDDAELLINLPPQIKQHPESQLINPGLPVTFSVSASGAPPLSFQWQKDGVDLSGAASENFIIDSVSENNEGYYSCTVSNNAGSVISKDAELFLNVLPAKASSGKVPESAAPDNASVQQDKLIVAAEVTQKPTKTIKPKYSASTDISAKKESAITRIKKQSLFVFKSLSLKPPLGQGLYTHNGDILTYKGVAFPHATLVSANLEDDQGFTIRDVSKGLEIERETGNINGSIFVGSFRGAETVNLKITIQCPSNKQVVTGISNTLFIDQGYPMVRVTEPANHKDFNTSPIVIYGTASDDISGIAAVEISTDGGSSYCSVDIIRNNQWLYSFTPKKPNAEYKIKVRSTDGVGLSTESDYLTIHYNAPSAPVRKVTKTPMRNASKKINGKTDKSPDDDGICTYRIISLSSNNFQPADVFTLKEQMAIIVKGYGGKMVTLRIIDPSGGKTLFELSDFIPPHKNKMWKWKLSQTGTFQAALFVDGTFEDDIFFTIIQ